MFLWMVNSHGRSPLPSAAASFAGASSAWIDAPVVYFWARCDFWCPTTPACTECLFDTCVAKRDLSVDEVVAESVKTCLPRVTIRGQNSQGHFKRSQQFMGASRALLCCARMSLVQAEGVSLQIPWRPRGPRVNQLRGFHESAMKCCTSQCAVKSQEQAAAFW